MAGPPVGDHLAVSRDRVLVAEARAAHVAAARVDDKAVVEARGLNVPDVRLEHERLDPLVAQLRVTACVAVQVLDACDLEPDEIVRVVRDPLGVRLGEPDPHVGCEMEAAHARESTARRHDRPCAERTAA